MVVVTAWISQAAADAVGDDKFVQERIVRTESQVAGVLDREARLEGPVTALPHDRRSKSSFGLPRGATPPRR